jgi:hypothetical protein
MYPINESLESENLNPYQKINNIISEILCANGSCPID